MGVVNTATRRLIAEAKEMAVQHILKVLGDTRILTKRSFLIILADVSTEETDPTEETEAEETTAALGLKDKNNELVSFARKKDT